MLTRDKLTPTQWAIVRDTPHFVMLAATSDGGCLLDDMLERHAGMRGIADAANSAHPLIRSLAEASQIIEAQEQVRRWYYQLADTERTARVLQDQALQSLSQALDIIADHGDDDDLVIYRCFVLETAMRVARAAREGDVFGVGGKRISSGESDFLRRLEGIAESVLAPA